MEQFVIRSELMSINGTSHKKQKNGLSPMGTGWEVQSSWSETVNKLLENLGVCSFILWPLVGMFWNIKNNLIIKRVSVPVCDRTLCFLWHEKRNQFSWSSSVDNWRHKLSSSFQTGTSVTGFFIPPLLCSTLTREDFSCMCGLEYSKGIQRNAHLSNLSYPGCMSWH